MKNYLQNEANRIKGKCGSGYESDTYAAGNRYIASVVAETKKARKDNQKNETILKAMRS